MGCLVVVAPGALASQDQTDSQSFSRSGSLNQSSINLDWQANLLDLNNLRNLSVEDASPKDIEKAVEFASSSTGVRKDFLMGMLVVESNLGQNTGKCTYEEVEEGALNAHARGFLSGRAWENFNERKDIIQALAKDLKYDYESLRVSCNPPYSGTGGAMGIPQFMPDTWLEYKDRIKSIVKKENPDPWNVTDGVVAMALKLADVPGVTQHDIFSERNAAKMYLSGNTSWKYDWYANQVVYWSKNYKNLIG